MTRPRVIVTRRLPAAVEAAVGEQFDAELSTDDRPPTAEQLQWMLGQCDGLLATVTDRLTADVLAAYPMRTRIIANFGVGTDHIDLAAASAHDIVVTNTPDVLTECTADLAMLLILMTMRRAGEGERLVRAGEWTGWRPNDLVGRRVSGKTLGIVGMGRIGRAVAGRAHHGFGMRILCFNPSPVAAGDLAAVGAESRATLEGLLADADVVSLHTKLTPATRHMINSGNIGLLRKGTVIVNCARGELVELGALVASLKSGHILAYAADVLDQEPPPRDHPLLALPNAIITPHIGSRTFESVQRQATCAVENLTLFLSGKPPIAQANAV